MMTHSIPAGLFFRFLELRARFGQDTRADRRDSMKVYFFSLCFLFHRMFLDSIVILSSRKLRLLGFFFILFVAPWSSSELEFPLRTLYLFPDIKA
ncbi:hypothetical protein KFK09_019431 [Dendrobium nobile]|uniref:Uncharacterized protein n=1 Tax=Dendrobium nobile TaxID=94219 RepID=A0A8T3AQ77_DENNO|nr:hypothetical protein KFK09_019431 [Dendrobium nobile]